MRAKELVEETGQSIYDQVQDQLTTCVDKNNFFSGPCCNFISHGRFALAGFNYPLHGWYAISKLSFQLGKSYWPNINWLSNIYFVSPGNEIKRFAKVTHKMEKECAVLTDFDFDKLPNVCIVLEISVKVLEVCES